MSIGLGLYAHLLHFTDITLFGSVQHLRQIEIGSCAPLGNHDTTRQIRTKESTRHRPGSRTETSGGASSTSKTG